MGHHDKIPITSEKKVTYSGIFDMKETYKYLKGFLEESKHYDVTEKDYEEDNLGDNKRVTVAFEAEQEFTDYYKVFLKFKLDMSGKEVIIETSEGKSLKRIEGKAKLVVNSYILADWQNKRGKSPFFNFLDKVYTKYIGKSEMEKCILAAVMDANELLARFRQQMNMTM